ncbi:cobaltochelatase subunit CobN [Azovibrio restrictus]|uniref:cobaltochelatase subunit CobN n=1 Tax=Azovibrio restrictus TaxID=146938 RepID=UPI0003F7D416|nr:cobaltochelatase subunit CobN [Azovibrio restrictus]
MPLFRFLLLFSSLLLGLAASAVQARDTQVLFLAASPVQPGKFVNLERLARAQGVRLQARFAEKLPAEVDGSLFQEADLVILDAPRDHIEAYVRGRLGQALEALEHKPHIWMNTQQPRFAGLAPELAGRLHGYYVNGARSNFEHFFQAIAARDDPAALARVPPPIRFPTSAIYHPRAPSLVFADAPAYLAWKGHDERRPVVAIALHQQYIAAEQTAFIDDLIARIEAAGAVPLPFYTPILGEESVRQLLVRQGKPLADVLINTQIMLNPDGRRKEFEAMGIPVIQAMPYRKGDEADWLADSQGVSLMDVPFYLAQAEYAGITDILIAAASRVDDQVVAIEAQAAAAVHKALRQVALQRKANRDKRLAIFFYNYPPGEKNLSASFLNVPRSLGSTLDSLQRAGYATQVEPESTLVPLLQRLLRPYYRAGELPGLLADGLAATFPVARYEAWLQTLPPAVRRELEAQGSPRQGPMIVERDGAPHFVIPRLQLGQVTILPQPSRAETYGQSAAMREKALYHSSKAPPSHYYLATYLWAREALGADALIHYGTHGSYEWLPGKERGLSVHDYPMLAVGDLPVLYPYIVDNIGEALQAKRRGRAITITHQTPPFTPAGLHQALVEIHDLLHDWLNQDQGLVRDKLREGILERVRRQRIDQDLGLSRARIEQDFPAFIRRLHDHLHELAQTAQPLGLHTLGQAPEERHRIGTVLLILGKDYWAAAAAPGEAADESFVGDYSRLAESRPYQLIQRHVVQGESAAGLPPALQGYLAQARRHYQALGAAQEADALLAGLAGRYLPTSYGGDPVKNPDTLPTGRNLYGFDPSRIPTRAAWEAGKEAMENLLAEHRKLKGQTPKKLTFSLWSVETMRHQGMLEAQALWALGVEPVWDGGGRVSDVKLIPRQELKRPRVDVVLSATGLYRDQFPNTMKHLAKAVQLAAQAQEADNPVWANARDIRAQLLRQGLDEAAATRAAQTRIFSSESGRYGTGLDDAALATDTWKGKAEGDRKLAQLYLSRMQFAYGPDEAEWGQAGPRGVNLYAAHLKGTEGAVLSRSSNLYGMLTTDDPFQYLGGIALAVRHLDGQAPELYISNLRGSGSGKVEGVAQFMAKELATRNFHPGYIQGLMQEGYSGTLQVLDGINNFWGWQATAREVVRDDQWQEFVDVYVRDKHRLGLKDWFEKENPHALAQSIERMLEAARQGYWQADAATLAELKQRYRELARRHDVKSDNPVFEQFVAAGFGTAAARPALQAPTRPQKADDLAAPEPEPAPAPPPIQGMLLEKVAPPRADPMLPYTLAGLLLLVLSTLGGGGAALLRQRRSPSC